MPFLSPEFALIFVAFFPIYWALQGWIRAQNLALLALSWALLFYAKPSALLAVVLYGAFIALLDHWLDKLLNDEASPQSALWLGIVGSVAFLASMKYFDDYAPWLRELGFAEHLDVVMPLGLSYYSFQAISYLVERSRGEAPALPVPELLLHFSFFPTITAGPIARAFDFKSALGVQRGMYGQLTEERQLEHTARAVFLVLLGVFKVWVVSGYLAQQWVRPIFENPLDYSILQQMSAWYGYTFQLYFDFSGYSDLVCGLALLLGFDLPQNFDSPLNAPNIQNFWTRWHISLSTWIRDYIYIPLGGNRVGFGRMQLNLLLAFVLSGIWHGSSVNFLLWGFLHGVALVLFNLWRRLFGEPQSALARGVRVFFGWLLTFHFVVLSFVIFRTSNWQDFLHLGEALWLSEKPNDFMQLLPMATFGLYLISQPLRRLLRHHLPVWLNALPVWLWALPLSLVFTLLILLAPEGIPEFIYANF